MQIHAFMVHPKVLNMTFILPIHCCFSSFFEQAFVNHLYAIVAAGFVSYASAAARKAKISNIKHKTTCNLMVSLLHLHETLTAFSDNLSAYVSSVMLHDSVHDEYLSCRNCCSAIMSKLEWQKLAIFQNYFLILFLDTILILN